MRLLSLLLAAVVTLAAGPGLAQDMNYNPFQVGARSALMGGAVVGGVRDSSAVFYNPGALGFVAETNLSLTATALRYGESTIKDALGSGQSLDDSFYDVVPLLVSGSFRLSPESPWTVGYALVTRQQLEASYRGAVRSMADVSPAFVGDEMFLGQYDDARQVDDIWGMAVVSWRMGDRLAVGGGPIVSYRDESRRQRFSTNLQSTTTAPATQIFQLTQLFDAAFYQWSLMGKLGIAWEPTAWMKLGATVTTPAVKLYGEGEEQGEIVLASLAGDGNARSLQQGLETKYRTPLFVGAGAEFALSSRWSLGLGVEYADRLERKPVIETDPGRDFFAGTPQFIGSSPNLVVLDQRKAVVNVSVGAEYRVNDTYSTYAGFWTDFSPIDIDDSKEQLRRDDIGQPLATSAVDVYNLVLGVSRRTRDRILSLGVTGGYGTGRVAGNLDFVGATAIGGGGALPDVVERKLSYFTGALLLSFTQFF